MSLAFPLAPSQEAKHSPAYREYHQMDRGASGYSSHSGSAKPHTPQSDPVAQASTDPPSRPHDASSGAIMEGDNNNNRIPYGSQSQTPTSEYGMHPSSARSASFPEHAGHPPYQESSASAAASRYPPSGAPHNTPGGMRPDDDDDDEDAKKAILTLADARGGDDHTTLGDQSDRSIPIDPSLARSNPNFPPSQYAYAPAAHEMGHGYPPNPHGAGDWRPNWSPQHPPVGGPYAGIPSPYSPQSTNVSAASSPAIARSPGQMNQVYSFVPIPGATQHKRPRRKFEEIERMYSCGWNGCQKAYGTLNHLNAHVTMQNHGPKRVPDEFKEIRREWKARKKEDELMQKKAEEEKLRQQAESHGHGHHEGPDSLDGQGQPGSAYGSRPQLPPINYSGAPSMQYYGAPTSGSDQMQMYGGSPAYPPYPTAYSGSGYPQDYQAPDSQYPPGNNPPNPGPNYRQ